MSVTVRAFAKINLGLCIGSLRADGFHELRTVYQTIALHDVIRVQVVRGSGVEIRCADARVPCDPSNTCYRIAERAMAALNAKGRVVVEIEKRLPVQGGLGGASANAVATLLGLQRELKKPLSGSEGLRIAAEVGSDLPLFLVGGTILGVGRGEEVYPVPDLPETHCVIATPEIGVSTPRAFTAWDRMWSDGSAPALTRSSPSARMTEVSRVVSAWLSGAPGGEGFRRTVSGVLAHGRGRAEILLLDLVRTGIENDFERVVFPQHPELREVKSVLVGAGADYASLSGSGSAVFGLFRSGAVARRAAAALAKLGVPSRATKTLSRPGYWRKIFD
ncbi:MAG TPA: 4-(cytidine 5'-diphospho)-2-C-methyl-D-erythritol kinase [Terriglobales bacterium]|nr:4-(cytidine 5'-diphospho)-2-C-methyl-D-erythritol kinase [Terriglobales bacterium]